MEHDPVDFPRIAIIGAGSEGAQLASLAVHAGLHTIVEDVFPSRLRGIENRLREGVGDQPGTEFDLALLEFASTIEDALRNADVVIDSVPDELESKLEIFSLVDRMAPPRTILCSPLNAVGIGDLASCTYRADRCIGLKIEAGKQDWVEVPTVMLVRGAGTSDETAEIVSDLWRRMGKQVTLIAE